MAMRCSLLCLVAWTLSACGLGESAIHQEPLTSQEKKRLVELVESVEGTKYNWGGDSPLKGFDCSGLIQWTFRELGYYKFKNGDQAYSEIAAHELYHYNTKKVQSLDRLEKGDLVFFDPNEDGRIEHVSIFVNQDEDGDVWVYDSFSKAGKVAYRKVEDFYSKSPKFGNPLGTTVRFRVGRFTLDNSK